MPEALDRFASNPTVTGWFPQGFADVYTSHKRGEIAALDGMSETEVCALYERVY
ncbi:MAG: hypothetical protein R3D87_03265 [Paracoccaceae bacterium]